jgi:hypothetical protein
MKMRKGLVVKLIVLLMAASLVFAACGKKADEKISTDNISSISASSSTGESEKTDTVKKTAKNNVEAFLDYVKAIDGEIKYWEGHNKTKFIITLAKLYKDDIVNKYTNGKKVDTASRTSSYFTHVDTVVDKSESVNLVSLVSEEELKSTDTKKVQYCLNLGSKGCVIGFLFYDGIYLYEVDEQGKKINEVTYLFKEGKAF